MALLCLPHPFFHPHDLTPDHTLLDLGASDCLGHHTVGRVSAIASQLKHKYVYKSWPLQSVPHTMKDNLDKAFAKKSS